MKMPSVENRPKRPGVVGAAVYGFLCGTTLLGGFVAAVIADQLRVRRNRRRLARQAKR